MKKIVLLALVLVLLSTAVVVGFIRPVKSDWTWTETIYIRADGSVDPHTAPISTVDNITYTLTDNIVGDVLDYSIAIVVERDNIVVDGADYMLQGTGSGRGIYLTGRSNVTIKNMTIKGFYEGITLYFYSSNNTISGNNITNNRDGLFLVASSGNSISGNNITNNNEYGIFLGGSSSNNITGNNITHNKVGGIWLLSLITAAYLNSSNNIISGNNITNNSAGISLYYSSDNIIYHNNIIDNTQQVYIETSGYPNIWDDGYPSGGNYWSNYIGVDSDYDGLGDTVHALDANNTDNHPLMGMFSDFPVTPQEETYHVTTICSSIISEFQFNGTTISFNVTGLDYTVGSCRVTIPNIIVQDLWQGNYRVLVDGEEPIMTNNWTDGTYTYIYFKYLLSEHKVEIVPEFPTWTSMLLILIVLTVAIAIYKRRHTELP